MKKSHLLCLGTVIAFSSAANANYHHINKYEVTVTNITKSINFTPIMVAAHKRNVEFFEVGEPASQALADAAEGGNTAGIEELFNHSTDQVLTAKGETIPLLQAGESSSVIFESRLKRPKFSIASMLLPTNDAFVAAESITLPVRQREKTIYLRAYDAGSEANDELCVNIPGPTCGGTPFSAQDATDEGFVYVHNGIHGIADLNASQYTWNNPVMKVTIKRLYY